MKKFTIAAIIVGLFIVYSLVYNHSNTIAVIPGNTSNSGSLAGSSNGTSTTPGTTDTPATTGSSGALYKDGSYTGSVEDAYWGNLQVKVIIQSGKITDVQFLQYPNDRNRSIMINQYADPQLTSEAIQAQSANIDVITGATDSSQAFIQSLTNALSQAKA